MADNSNLKMVTVHLLKSDLNKMDSLVKRGLAANVREYIRNAVTQTIDSTMMANPTVISYGIDTADKPGKPSERRGPKPKTRKLIAGGQAR